MVIAIITKDSMGREDFCLQFLHFLISIRQLCP